VGDLWGRAFTAKPVRPLALEALRSWLELADRDEAAVAPVSRVVEAVVRLGGKHPERMEYYLEQWASDLKKPVRSAQRVLAVIVR
jgi:biopolymer transport protein ExbB/TolQ